MFAQSLIEGDRNVWPWIRQAGVLMLRGEPSCLLSDGSRVSIL